MALCLSFRLFFFRANLHKNWETLEKQPNTLSTTLNSVMGQDYNKYIQNKEINVLYAFETSLIFSYQQALLNLIFFYESPNFILILTIDKLSIYQQISRPLVTYVVSLPEKSQFPNYIYVNFVQQCVKEKVIQTSLQLQINFYHTTYTDPKTKPSSCLIKKPPYWVLFGIIPCFSHLLLKEIEAPLLFEEGS